MEEALIHTARSLHGTGADLKLPNFTEDANWQGLAQLYSVNESLFEHRHDYSPSLEDWANFAKDVDSMFALLIDLKSRTEPLESWADLGSGAGGVEEASGAGVTDPTEWHLLLTSGPQKLTPATPLPPQWTRKSANDLPERLPSKPTSQSSNRQDDLRTQSSRNEPDRDDLIFSGNGLTELETHHDFLFASAALETLRELDRARGDNGGRLEANEEDENIFEAQIYLPARLPFQAEKTAPSHAPLHNLRTLNAQEPHDSQEGSGLQISLSSTSL